MPLSKEEKERDTLTSNVMVVTKEGDLELYAVHDTATHTPWSARGDLAVGLGKSYTILPGLHEPQPPPEPWDLTVSSFHHATPRSVQKPLLHEDVPIRGRNGAPSPATFGRGDEDGFPALASSARGLANLSATRPGSARSRAISPAAWRSKYFEHTGVVKRALASPSPGRGELGSKTRHKSLTRRNKELPPMWSHSESPLQLGIESDVSMVMRHRVVEGYGLVNVRHAGL